ncbi:HutD family protein [Rhodococcus globerulus]|uniref:HutD family protein n=1 Tax=Rhodococcus globerulus TaxID=33008 RepID=A0ABU4C412_RHOGO|nr:HutD family protein [Rhodococcus globerulus]MDV6271240.1 HutD family protein [Rhodococcus globerulus]
MSERVRLVRADDRRRVPWKNGAGFTGEVAVDEHLPPRWRVSVAELGFASSWFSSFEGKRRIFTVVGTHGATLDFGGRTSVVEPLHPFQFEGRSRPMCMPAGETQALNVIADVHGPAVSVIVHRSRHSPLRTDPLATTVLYVHSGRADVAGQSALPGTSIVVTGYAAEVYCDATLVVAEIRSETDKTRLSAVALEFDATVRS